MEWRLFTVEEIIVLHDAVLNPGELSGMAQGASLEGALARVEFRVQYGMIQDAYDLAAMCAVAISRAHAFRDANKRTAHVALEFVLLSYDIQIQFDTTTVGDIIIQTAQGQLDEVELTDWLRRARHR